jgi:hypothetical protein
MAHRDQPDSCGLVGPAIGIVLFGIAIVAGGELLQVLPDIEHNTRPKGIQGPAGRSAEQSLLI